MGRRVLIVDDDRAIRALVQTLVGRRGFPVDAAADGNEAHALLSANAYDVILLDLMMPALNGFDLIERLRSEHPAILRRVIVMTAFSRGGQLPPIEAIEAFVARTVRRWAVPSDLRDAANPVLLTQRSTFRVGSRSRDG